MDIDLTEPTSWQTPFVRACLKYKRWPPTLLAMVSLRHFQTTTTTTSCLRTTCKRWTSSDSMKMEPPILARPTGGCGNIARTALRAPLAKRSFVGPVQAIDTSKPNSLAMGSPETKQISANLVLAPSSDAPCP